MDGPLDPGTLLGPAIDAIRSGLESVLPSALMVAAIVFVLYEGWRFARWLMLESTWQENRAYKRGDWD
jgi:hypothetical protein